MNLFKTLTAAAAQTDGKKQKPLGLQLVIPAICMLISIGALAAASMAWFSMNRDVNSNGMNMDVEVSSNLIISRSTTGANAITSVSASSITVAASEWATENGYNDGKFRPATHENANPYTASATSTTSNPLLLIYNYNPKAVSPTTGLAKDGGTALTFEPVSTAANNQSPYYRDYTVYIASNGQSFNAQKLEATITGKIKNPAYDAENPGNTAEWLDVTSTDYENAASVDFWLATTSAATPAYIGTLHLRDQGTSSGTIDLLNNTSTLVPLNTSDYYTVIMRFYYDGALGVTNSPTKTFINSAEVSSAQLSLNIAFAATDAAA